MNRFGFVKGCKPFPHFLLHYRPRAVDETAPDDAVDSLVGIVVPEAAGQGRGPSQPDRAWAGKQFRLLAAAVAVARPW